jgi:thiol-disulfide isomerase/thioredoxin
MKIWLRRSAWIVVALAAIGGLWYWQTLPGEYDELAQCLSDKGAKFYGAFWCPHCQKQKQMFGRSERHLPYIECSTADGNSQLPICRDHGVKEYPTWVFADGSRMTGEIPLATLAQKTGCQL